VTRDVGRRIGDEDDDIGIRRQRLQRDAAHVAA